MRGGFSPGQMSDEPPDRQTQTWINQYPCHWVKSTSSSHVLWGVCSRLLILSGGARWPLSRCCRLSRCKSGGGGNSSSHNSIRHLHIEHLHPKKTCQYLSLLPLLGGRAPWPRGRHLPRLPLLPLADPVRPGDNTWPHPEDGMIGVQGKCAVCSRPLWPRLAPPGPGPALGL